MSLAQMSASIWLDLLMPHVQQVARRMKTQKKINICDHSKAWIQATYWQNLAERSTKHMSVGLDGDTQLWLPSCWMIKKIHGPSLSPSHWPKGSEMERNRKLGSLAPTTLGNKILDLCLLLWDPETPGKH